MALFCAVIRRDPVSLLRFHFFSHIQVFSFKIPLVCRLKYPYNCFSSYFCFLVMIILLILVLFVLFLIVVISLSLHCFIQSSRRLIEVSTVKLASVVEGDPKAPFSIATTTRCTGGRYFFPGLLHFTLDTYLIMLSVKQGSIKYHFSSLWYDSTWD